MTTPKLAIACLAALALAACGTTAEETQDRPHVYAVEDAATLHAKCALCLDRINPDSTIDPATLIDATNLIFLAADQIDADLSANTPPYPMLDTLVADARRLMLSVEPQLADTTTAQGLNFHNKKQQLLSRPRGPQLLSAIADGDIRPLFPQDTAPEATPAPDPQ